MYNPFYVMTSPKYQFIRDTIIILEKEYDEPNLKKKWVSLLEKDNVQPNKQRRLSYPHDKVVDQPNLEISLEKDGEHLDIRKEPSSLF